MWGILDMLWRVAVTVGRFLGDVIEFLNAYNGAVTAAATVFIGIFTYVLARVTRRSIDLAREEFNATHRPEIIVHNFEVAREEVDDGFALCAQFTIVNKGTADAIILDVGGTIFITDKLRPGALMSSRGFINRPLAAGEIIRDVGITGGALDTAMVDMDSGYGKKYAPGDAKLWCIGCIVYEDSGGRRRETGFCRSYDVLGERWVKEPESDYEYAY